MFCTRCGIELSDSANYCSVCGAATPNARPSSSAQQPRAERFSRPLEGGKIGGVCAGVARYWGIDVTIVRILWAITAIWPPFIGALVYLVCWIVMPRDTAPAMGAAQNSAAV
jgi:phage shock protein C